MIKVEYCPVRGCVGWVFRNPTEEVDKRERKSRVKNKFNKM